MTDNSNAPTAPASPPVGPTPGEGSRRIVVGVDGSPQSELALRWARNLAETMGATIDAVTAWEIPMTAYGWPNFPVGWEPDKDAATMLAHATKSAFGDDAPVGLSLIVREGNATKVLLDASEGAQLLIVGSRGHGGFVGLLIGSVSASCAEHASCPVLVVHGDNPPTTAGAR
jgi:nucleotide-binding universal stress UspA family protein